MKQSLESAKKDRLYPLGLQLEDGVQGDGVLLQQLVPVLGADQDLQVPADVGGRVLQQDRGCDPVSHRQVGDGVACGAKL